MSGNIKQTPTYTDKDINLNLNDEENLWNPGSGSQGKLSKPRLGRSNDRLHETTPLFGLWQGYDSNKMSLSDENLQNYIQNNTLFLPGQNQTNIRAHIGTTVIMDCKIVRPNIEKYVPVSIRKYLKNNNEYLKNIYY